MAEACETFFNRLAQRTYDSTVKGGEINRFLQINETDTFCQSNQFRQPFVNQDHLSDYQSYEEYIVISETF